ncbi:MAG: GntR family transcriptional regulator [Nocardioides sp.]|uniref:GntR family transcriptional regulator n=1 Tax=Nocardioides sp. TaxID=35761 RepID=UPI0039E5972D
MNAVETTYRSLWQMIVDGAFAPGQRLKEPDLVAELGVSRTPLREALRALGSDGLVTLSGRGAMVWLPSLDEVRDLYAYRAVLEGFTAEVAARRNAAGEVAPSQLRRLRELMDEVESADGSGRVTANVAFHTQIAELSGNVNAQRSLSRVWAQIAVVSSQNFHTPSWPEAAFEAHRRIVGAIEQGDPSAAARVGREHVEQAASVYSHMDC